MTLVDQKLEELRSQVAAFGLPSAGMALEKLLGLEAGVGYRRYVPISECNEALLEIPIANFPRVEPHPYQQAGAPYATYSPHHARKSVIHRLELAQSELDSLQPGYRIVIFDAYRPLSVQSFMVNHELEKLARARNLDPARLDEATSESLLKLVYTIWAKPTDDPSCPTSHSTGGALDVTILTQDGTPLDMGSEIDAIGDVSLPSFFELATDSAERTFHLNRQLLETAMSRAGFSRLPYEWWHFSYGDQLWALTQWLDGATREPRAIYGRFESLSSPEQGQN